MREINLYRLSGLRSTRYVSLMVFWLHVAGSWIMRYLPAPWAYAVARLLTPPVLLLAPGYYRRAFDNMSQVLGAEADPRRTRALTVNAFTNYARYMVDLLRLPHMETESILRNVRVQGWENVEQAYDRRCGVILVTGHIGNWDLAGAAFVARKRTVSAVVETLRPARWNSRVQAIRERVGVKPIAIEAGLREMLATLRRGEGLAILVDRPVQEDGVSVTFFGRSTRVPAGAATLAVRTGASIVPAVVVRDPAGRGYLARIGEPLHPDPEQSRESAVQVLTQRFMSWLEGMIREYPDQWYMFRVMWPGLPDAERRTLQEPGALPVSWRT